MRLITDTNILVSFFRKNPVQEIIKNSRSLNLELVAPEYAFDELNNNKQDILKYSGLLNKQFEDRLLELKDYIKLIPADFFREFKSEAKQLIHDKDIPFFALALKLKCPIWSNEPLFKKQSQIKVFSNKDMIEIFG